MNAYSMMDSILEQYNNMKPITTSKAVVKIAPKLIKKMPENDSDFLEICNDMMESKQWIMFQMVTTWIKMRKSVYLIEYFDIYQNWLFEYTKRWGACDILCYRVLNPMVEKHCDLFHNVLNWAKDERTYVKRASAVSLINSTAHSFKINVPFNWVEQVCDIHIDDKHIHIEKAIGWLLKYSYLTYPNNTDDYLKKNILKLSRTTFRYALEKMDMDKRAYFMSLSYK